MRGVRFYEEFDDLKKRTSSGTVLAAFVENGIFKSGDAWCYEGAGGVHDWADSPVASTTIATSYLAKHCKRVSETKARKVHPNLFVYLDQ